MTPPRAAQPPGTGRLTPLPATDADFVLRLRPDGRLLAASDTVTEVLGWDLERCAAEGIWTAIEDEAQCAAVRQVLQSVLATGSARTTLQVSGRGGGLWVDIAAKHLVDEPGSPVLVCARDVSHDVVAAVELAASEQQWRLAFEHSPIGGALLDDDGAVLVVNAALCRLLGRREHELTRMDVVDVVAGQGRQSWREWWEALRSGGPTTSTSDRLLQSADGAQLWGRLSAARTTPPGRPARVVLQIEDVTGRRAAELELANRALHDGLTGMPNRFLTRQWLASALEDDPAARVGVLYCDLDRFKVVNDSLGHAAGDGLLEQVAERLRRPLRPEDLLGRVGGDEFVMVLEGIDTEADLAEVAARLTEALDEPFDVAGHRHVVTLSLGGTIGAHRDSADDVLIRADMALLRAKRLGRARYVAFDPSQDRVSTRDDLQLEDDLRLSIEADELRAFYQPVVTIVDSVVVGHEALLRWEHPDQGLLLPDRFLDLAESTGLIRPLGWWMLSQACQDAAAGSGGLTPDSWVAVNASPSQLSRPGFADDVARALAESGLAPSRLHLEITETALITASATLTEQLRELGRLGVHIALDDFGTGYSSLSLLRQFPVDVVKIDKSFIEALLTDRSSYAIVKAVLSMCHDLTIPTVAEGVETHEQRDVLAGLGCSYGQGYLYGRPVPLHVRVPVPVRPATPHPRPTAGGQVHVAPRR